jgi:hypothetical protein
VLDRRGQADARQAQDAGGQFGVEELSGAQSDLGQTGQVLGGRVQDPLGAADRVVDR